MLSSIFISQVTILEKYLELYLNYKEKTYVMVVAWGCLRKILGILWLNSWSLEVFYDLLWFWGMFEFEKLSSQLILYSLNWPSPQEKPVDLRSLQVPIFAPHNWCSSVDSSCFSCSRSVFLLHAWHRKPLYFPTSHLWVQSERCLSCSIGSEGLCLFMDFFSCNLWCLRLPHIAIWVNLPVFPQGCVKIGHQFAGYVSKPRYFTRLMPFSACFDYI